MLFEPPIDEIAKKIFVSHVTFADGILRDKS